MEFPPVSRVWGSFIAVSNSEDLARLKIPSATGSFEFRFIDPVLETSIFRQMTRVRVTDEAYNADGILKQFRILYIAAEF